MEYTTDIVMVIDCGVRMIDVIQRVKREAMLFDQLFTESMAERGKGVGASRIKIIQFAKDVPGDTGVVSSQTFTLPLDRKSLCDYIDGIGIDSRQSTTNSALYAVHAALSFGWVNLGSHTRHIIVLWTNLTPDPSDCAASPDLDRDGLCWEQLETLWKGRGVRLSASGKRFVLYAPDVEPWHSIGWNWEHAVHCPSSAGDAISEKIRQDIMSACVLAV